MSGNDKPAMELVFSRSTSVSEQAKVKEFWEFIDATNDLRPHNVQRDLGKSSKKGTARGKVSGKTISKKGDTERNNTWYKKLKVFQELGLDRTALVSDNSCKFCCADSKYRSADFADAVKESYEEINEEMKAFDERSRIAEAQMKHDVP